MTFNRSKPLPKQRLLRTAWNAARVGWCVPPDKGTMHDSSTLAVTGQRAVTTMTVIEVETPARHVRHNELSCGSSGAPTPEHVRSRLAGTIEHAPRIKSRSMPTTDGSQPMIIHPAEQAAAPRGSRPRLGIPTSSQFSRILTPGGKLSASRDGYLAELIAEWALGEQFSEFAGTEWTERGHILEGEARAAYGLLRDADVTEVGTCYQGRASARGVVS